ncbi:Right handed beta helix region [Micromonospora citrea]|uniref:Right handed beta helix region n=1 Tax=Micromonospora citrea TaxID=47855 RepID=A0A1C6W221_9ACTN|nr:right-handed parallel beta-helix repeat-containing protein [Micromonospora citrea]SCL72625.1 Right handed beta helix region [Micromonospora citrea]
MRSLKHLLAAALIGLSSVVVVASAAAAEGVQTIYMNASGDDARDGATPGSAVRSLARVQQLVAAGPLDTDVEVRIHAGTYVAQGIVWQTYRPGHTITFMPDDYEYGEGRDGIAALPVFQNARASGSGRYITGPWFYACPGNPGQPLAGGGTAGLRFYYLQVEHYASSALSLDGSAGSCGGGYQPSSAPGLPSARGLNGNTAFGMRFTKIGNAYTGGSCDDPDFLRCGYGGIVLTESSDNRIENNHFVDLRNSENSYIHAVYVTHKSSRNRFAGNQVTGVSSEPIKVRDGSNFNTFEQNVFGANGFLRASPSMVHYREEVNEAGNECSSYHNRFVGNDLGTYLIGSTANLPVWLLTPPGPTYKGAAACPALPAGEVRLTTANNAY